MRLFYICIIIILLIPQRFARAETVHLVINEIKVSGVSGQSTDEFVELFNPTTGIISLTGWQLVKRTSTGTESELVGDLGAVTLLPQHYLLITHPTGYLGEPDPDLVYSTGNSIADNNTVILKDAGGQAIDLVGFGTAQTYEGAAASNPGSAKSIERSVVGSDTDHNANDFIIRETPTPSNSLAIVSVLDEEPAPVVYSNEIRISELFPNPMGTDDGEFIEVTNVSGESVVVTGWQLGDGSTRRHTISELVIPAHGYYSFPKSATGISLNNTGDTVRLYWPEGTMVDERTYVATNEGQSFALVNGMWQWTDAVTPGLANELLIANEPPVADFTVDAQTVRLGQSVSFDARASTDPDGDSLEYGWDFGDGSVATGNSIEHAYDRAGIFTVRLTVADSHGAVADETQAIEVRDYDYSKGVLLSELFPSCSPTDSTCEFIELCNDTDQPLDLAGWQITDQSKYYTFPEDSSIAAQTCLSVDRPTSGIALNNTGDTVYVLDPSHAIIDGVAYGKATKDYSFARADGRWFWTEAITPGAGNEIVERETENEKDAETAAAPVDVGTVAISDVSEEMIGSRITITGEVERANTRGIYLMDESGTMLRIYIQKATGIVQPALEPGDTVTVSGVLDKTSAGLRLLPQVTSDIVVHSDSSVEAGHVLGESTASPDIIPVAAENTSQQMMWYLIGAGVVIIGGVAAYVIREYRARRKP